MLQQNMLKVQQIMCASARSFGQHNKKHIYKNEGQKYERLRYYPRYVMLPSTKIEVKSVLRIILLYRDPNQPDKPIENPVKLFKVQRIKPMKGNPFWEKNILQLLGVSESVGLL